MRGEREVSLFRDKDISIYKVTIKIEVYDKLHSLWKINNYKDSSLNLIYNKV